MNFAVKEIYYTLQGEGVHAGRAAVFCRFSGCNLWSGREPDRATAACKFCDTDFVGVDGPCGGNYDSPEALAEAIDQKWPENATAGKKFVVCTGGEPLLQVNTSLLAALHLRKFEVAVETNGTVKVPVGVDWLCVSPKVGAKLVQRSGDELKLVYPQQGVTPADFEPLCFRNFFLQPMDGPDRAANSELAVRYCLDHPRWRLSLQTHKFLGIQ
jgi:7-carboxy-7-deazaguanine synthase (Cx14CxxC type)